jgi:hypothetical protein
LPDVLPILDGFDEYSDQLLSAALGVLSNRKYGPWPMVFASRPVPELKPGDWRGILEATVIELAPLPAAVVAEYVDGAVLPGSAHALEPIAREVREHPDGKLAAALSCPFLLDIAVRRRGVSRPYDLIASVAGPGATDPSDLLARSFLEASMNGSWRWQNARTGRWLREVARRSQQAFHFRPNDLDPPPGATAVLLVAAALLPAAALAACLPRLPLLALAGAAAAFLVTLMVSSAYTGSEPTVNPRAELRRERGLALERARIAAVLTVALGVIDLLARHTGLWVLAVAGIVAGVVGILGGGPPRDRVTAGGVGLLYGPVLGWAAYIEPSLAGNWRFVIAGAVPGATVFAAVAIINLAGNIRGGQGRVALTLAPMLAICIALPVTFWAAWVAGIAADANLVLPWAVADKPVALAIFALAVSAAMLVATRWSLMWAGRLRAALTGSLPLALLGFLEDFAELGVLRRRGYSYEFKHPLLARNCEALPPRSAG